MGTRTRQSPATPAQLRFIEGLLKDRVVPANLLRRAERADLTDGDCRDLIPDLQECERRRSGRHDRDMDADWGNADDWWDHPDAVFGDPNEHGSH